VFASEDLLLDEEREQRIEEQSRGNLGIDLRARPRIHPCFQHLGQFADRLPDRVGEKRLLLFGEYLHLLEQQPHQLRILSEDVEEASRQHNQECAQI
jgi:hypothetical protein